MMTAVLINANPAIQNAKLAMAQIITIVKAVKALIIENFLLMNVCVNKDIIMTDLSNALNAIILGFFNIKLNKIVNHALEVILEVIALAARVPIIECMIQAIILACVWNIIITMELLLAKIAIFHGFIIATVIMNLKFNL